MYCYYNECESCGRELYQAHRDYVFKVGFQAKQGFLFFIFFSDPQNLWSELLGCTLSWSEGTLWGCKGGTRKTSVWRNKKCFKLRGSKEKQRLSSTHTNRNAGVWSRCRSKKEETEFFFVRDRNLHHTPSPESLAILSSCCPILSQPLHERCAAAIPPPCSRKASGNTQHLALLPRQRHCFFNNTSLGNRLQSHFRSQAMLTLTWWSLLSSAGQRSLGKL